MDSSVFEVTIPPADPGARLVAKHRGGKVIVSRENEPAFRLTIVGASRHALALVDAYNREVEREREAAWADADVEIDPHAPPLGDSCCGEPHAEHGRCTLPPGHAGPHWNCVTYGMWGPPPLCTNCNDWGCDECRAAPQPAAVTPPLRSRPCPMLTEIMEHC